MNTNLSGKTYVITGATSGIGLAAAEILAAQGAAVIGVGRSKERCQEAEKRLRTLNPAAEPAFLLADFSSQTQVRSLAAGIQDLLASRGLAALDGLANNAGTFTYWFTLTPEGFERTWAVNHLAPFLLTNLLLPRLQSASCGRIVTVSSGSHYAARLNWEDLQLRRRYNGLRAYGNTKLANVLFSLELNHRLGTSSTAGAKCHAFAADPGLVKTDIALKGSPALVHWVWKWRRSGGITPHESARGIVFLLTEPSIQESPEIYWKHSQPKAASPHALDPDSASRLWAISEQMCGPECGLRVEV